VIKSPDRTAFSHIAAFVIAVALLCLPALWNGFPLMFDDVGGYLERWPTGTLGHGRSTVYGLLLWITRWSSFAPAVLLQALVTTFVVDRAIRIYVPLSGQAPWLLPGVVVAISLTSGVALFVSKLIPDAWAAPAVLALHLLAWHGERFTKFERALMAAIIAFAGASHMAILGLLAGLLVVYAAAWFARRQLPLAPTGLVVAGAAVCSGLALLLCANAIVAGRLALTPGGEVFLFGRMVEDGTAGEILREECPRNDWQMCAFRNVLPDDAEAFIFGADSPLQKIGGGNDPRVQHEITSIIARSLVRHPLEHVAKALVLTGRQFVDVGTGGAMEPLMAPHARWTFTLYAPSLVDGFDAARQQTGPIDLALWSDWVVVPISIVASFSLPVLAVALWRRGRRREAVWPALLFLALIGNAAICGVIVGSNDRYQARLTWLATLTVGLTIYAWSRREFGGERGVGVVVTNAQVSANVGVSSPARPIDDTARAPEPAGAFPRLTLGDLSSPEQAIDRGE
jgi:hypothetical protein